MKKILSKALTGLMVIILAFSLAACGGDKNADEATQSVTEKVENAADAETAEEEKEIEIDEVVNIIGTKTMAYFHKYLLDGAYTMESRYEMDGMEVISLSAVDGNKMYSKTETNGMESIMILTEDAQYILDSASKIAIKMSVGVDGGLDMQEMFAEEEENYEVAVSTGDIEIDGEKYFYEEFNVEDSLVKYCFDGDEMKYIISEMGEDLYTMEIISMKKGADAKLFELPNGYEIMTF